MKRKNWLLFGGIAVLLVAAVLIVSSASRNRADGLIDPSNIVAARSPARQTPAQDHNHSHNTKRVPAFEVAPTPRQSRANTRPRKIHWHDSRCISRGSTDSDHDRAVAVLLPL